MWYQCSEGPRSWEAEKVSLFLSSHSLSTVCLVFRSLVLLTLSSLARYRSLLLSFSLILPFPRWFGRERHSEPGQSAGRTRRHRSLCCPLFAVGSHFLAIMECGLAFPFFMSFFPSLVATLHETVKVFVFVFVFATSFHSAHHLPPMCHVVRIDRAELRRVIATTFKAHPGLAAALAPDLLVCPLLSFSLSFLSVSFVVFSWHWLSSRFP